MSMVIKSMPIAISSMWPCFWIAVATKRRRVSGSIGEKLEKGDLVKEESQNVGNRRCSWLQFGDLDLNNYT